MTRGKHEALLAAAREALRGAHAPYSGLRVGAALLGKSDRTYTGCNIENASYGLTICAERVALFRAVAEGERSFQAVAVVSDSPQALYPCGACRQVLREFADDLEIIVAGSEGEPAETTLAELLPHAFGADDLPGHHGK